MEKQYKLEIKIEDLYSKIRKCESAKSACKYINQLMKINEIVTKMIFIEKIKVTDKLWRFFKDFDVSYDKNMCKFFFKKIKQGEYTLNESGK